MSRKILDPSSAYEDIMNEFLLDLKKAILHFERRRKNIEYVSGALDEFDDVKLSKHKVLVGSGDRQAGSFMGNE